ncbi:MAG: hypothetical protein V3V81_02440 [Candidatus Bathyarchaeia archaeon]
MDKGIIVYTFKKPRIPCTKENAYVTRNDDTERMTFQINFPQRTCPTPALKNDATAANTV